MHSITLGIQVLRQRVFKGDHIMFLRMYNRKYRPQNYAQFFHCPRSGYHLLFFDQWWEPFSGHAIASKFLQSALRQDKFSIVDVTVVRLTQVDWQVPNARFTNRD